MNCINGPTSTFTFKQLFLSLFILGIVVHGCKKEAPNNDPPQEQEPSSHNILQENAFLLDTQYVFKADDNSFLLKKTIPDYQPKIGDIILSAPATVCPNGLLRRITNITEAGDNIMCTTVPSNLNEAFKQLNISSKHADNYQSSTTLKKGASLSVNFEDHELSPSLFIKGSITFNILSSTLEYKKTLGSPSPEELSLKVEMNCEGSMLEFTNANSSAIHVPEKTISSYDLPILTVVVPIDSIPFPIQFKQKVTFKTGPFDISGKVNFSILPEMTAVIGCKYQNEIWKNISTYTINSSSPTEFTESDFVNNGSVNAQMTFFNPVYELSPLQNETQKASLELPNKISLEVGSDNPNYILKHNIVAQGTIAQKFWTGMDRTFDITGEALSKTVAARNWINGTMTDIDGNIYPTIKIGNQTWMIENLRTTKYNDGSLIPQIDSANWNRFHNDAYFHPYFDPANSKPAGLLYTKAAISKGKLAPIGWRVPTESDWDSLLVSLGGKKTDFTFFNYYPGLVEALTTIGTFPKSTNTSKFSAMIAPVRFPAGWFTDHPIFWTSTESQGGLKYVKLNATPSENASMVMIWEGSTTETIGFSIRCVKED